MRATYLKDVSENCYQDRHMAESFTNNEQIVICKADKLEKHMGNFTTEVAKYRDSSKFRMMDCEYKAGNNLAKAKECIADYLKDMAQDNDSLFSFSK